MNSCTCVIRKSIDSMMTRIETSLLKLGYIEFAMAGVRHSAIVNPAGQLLLTRRDNNN